jgi:hypothetical protein
MSGVVAHSRDLLDHLRHPRQAPQFRREPVRDRTLQKRPLQLPQILPVQSRLPTRPSSPTQAGDPVLLPREMPAVNARPADPELPGDLGLGVLPGRE